MTKKLHSRSGRSRTLLGFRRIPLDLFERAFKFTQSWLLDVMVELLLAMSPFSENAARDPTRRMTLTSVHSEPARERSELQL